MEIQVARQSCPAAAVARAVEDPDARALLGQVLAGGFVSRVRGERSAYRGPDPGDIRIDEIDGRARARLGPVERRREHVRADVLRVDLGSQAEERGQLVRRDVRRDGRAERVDELRQAWDEGLRVRLLAKGQEQALLSQAAVEVAGAVARTRKAERLDAIHVLDAARDVDPSQAGVERVAVVGDRDLDVDRHAAHDVDDLLESVEVDFDEVLDVEPVEVAHDRLEPVVAAGLGRPGEEIRATVDRRPPGIDLLRVDGSERLARGPGWDRHVRRVARQAEHRDLPGHGIDRHDDERVGVERPITWALVRPDEQDVEAFLAVPCGDRDRREGAADGCPDRSR